MNLEKAVDHGGHSGKTTNCDGFLDFPLGERENAEKLNNFAVLAVPQGYFLRGMSPWFELRL